MRPVGVAAEVRERRRCRRASPCVSFGWWLCREVVVRLCCGGRSACGAGLLGDFECDAYRGDLVVVKSIVVNVHTGIIEVEVEGKCRIVVRLDSYKIREG